MVGFVLVFAVVNVCYLDLIVDFLFNLLVGCFDLL